MAQAKIEVLVDGIENDKFPDIEVGMKLAIQAQEFAVIGASRNADNSQTITVKPVKSKRSRSGIAFVTATDLLKTFGDK